jgi:hypothetical protein
MVEIDMTMLLPISAVDIIIILNMKIVLGTEDTTMELDFSGGLGLGAKLGPLQAFVSFLPATPQICKGYIIIKTIAKSNLYYEALFFFTL